MLGLSLAFPPVSPIAMLHGLILECAERVFFVVSFARCHHISSFMVTNDASGSKCAWPDHFQKRLSLDVPLFFTSFHEECVRRKSILLFICARVCVPVCVCVRVCLLCINPAILAHTAGAYNER